MTWDGPSASQLLAAARATVVRPGDEWGGAWPRAAAFLARQALETGVSHLWTGELSGLRDCGFALQLLCLPFYLDDADVAHKARQTWFELSAGCHAHPYELAPTAGELRRWMANVDRLLTRVDELTGP